MLLKAAMPFNVSSSEYLCPHKRRKNWVSPVSRASPAHMNSPWLILFIVEEDAPYTFLRKWGMNMNTCRNGIKCGIINHGPWPISTHRQKCTNLYNTSITGQISGWQLVDDKSVASCQQITCCKLIVKSCCPQAWYKLFHANDKSWKGWLYITTYWNIMKLISLFQLVDKLQQAGKIVMTTCNKSAA